MELDEGLVHDLEYRAFSKTPWIQFLPFCGFVAGTCRGVSGVHVPWQLWLPYRGQQGAPRLAFLGPSEHLLCFQSSAFVRALRFTTSFSTLNLA